MQKLPVELAGTGPHAVQTRSLRKRYGRAPALDGVNLTVPEGSVYVLVGENGVGKSTTLKTLLDIVVADSGAAEVFGLDSHSDGARVRAQLGYVPEREDVGYGWLRVGALQRYHAAFYPGWDASYAAELGRMFAVRPEVPFGSLSKGQQRRVQLLLALAHHPALLVLDEPTDGLDPVMRDQVLSALAGHMARFPTTVLMSTHQVHEAERLGDHLGVMRAGRIEAQVTRERLRRCLRRYHFAVPREWRPPQALSEAVITRNGSQREAAWVVWGEEADVVARLRSAGADVVDVRPLTLEDAALAMLAREPARSLAEGDLAMPTAGHAPAHS